MSKVFVKLHIGLDDSDSPSWGCTTHLAYLIIKRLLNELPGIQFLDYPNLVRLNPTVPHKTRGNGAVAIRVLVDEESINRITELLEDELSSYITKIHHKPETNPGLVLYIGEIKQELEHFYKKALTDYVHMDFLLNLIEKLNPNIKVLGKLSKGIIGALAAIGALKSGDCTYELIAYRDPDNIGRERCINPESVKKIDTLFENSLFGNYDYLDNKPLITPHGPDPVLLGIRGEDPQILVDAFHKLELCENVSGWIIFRTNQGTDAHLEVRREIAEFRPYQTGYIEGYVADPPGSIPGGDVLITVSEDLKKRSHSIKAVLFKETGLNNIGRKLLPGDKVIVYGSGKWWSDLGVVINVEKIYVFPIRAIKYMNPRCPKCGKRMKSAGKRKGWKCKKCGYKCIDLPKEEVIIERDIKEGYYIPVDHAIKHLNKPLRRINKQKECGYLPPETMWIM